MNRPTTFTDKDVELIRSLLADPDIVRHLTVEEEHGLDDLESRLVLEVANTPLAQIDGLLRERYPAPELLPGAASLTSGILTATDQEFASFRIAEGPKSVYGVVRIHEDLFLSLNRENARKVVLRVLHSASEAMMAHYDEHAGKAGEP